MYTSVRLISRWYTTTRCRNNNCGWTIIWKFQQITRQLMCKLLVARLLYYSLRHLAWHCSRVSKLFPFPSQPPQMNCSHAADSGLQKYLSIAALHKLAIFFSMYFQMTYIHSHLHGPVSGGRLQTVWHTDGSTHSPATSTNPSGQKQPMFCEKKIVQGSLEYSSRIIYSQLQPLSISRKFLIPGF